jgi:hypothetical protein
MPCPSRITVHVSRFAQNAAISSRPPAPPSPLWRRDSTAVAEPEEKIKPTADTVIVLWMAGGMAHTDTFDPKRYTAFTPGLKPDAVLSTFPQIDTVVDNIKLTAGLGTSRA